MDVPLTILDESVDTPALQNPDYFPMDVNSLANICNNSLQPDPTTTSSDVKPAKDELIVEEDDNTESFRKEVFLPYEHREWVPGCVKHPGNIVEPASLAAVDSEVSGTSDIAQSLPPATIQSGKLSSLQLESIIKAAARHRVLLPNGERAGFFIGDAAGVGKGRQIAGVIMDNYCRGRAKHIWFSVSTDLIIDAKRDLNDIGCYINVIDGCKAIDKGTKLFGLSDSVKTGVLFSTYSTLISHIQTGAMGAVKKSRLQQLIDWCSGTNFDGCLVFDECHKAKNFVPGNETSSSKVAMAVCAIQKTLPKARVLYCSATGVTDVRNMAFMERLGLWGEATAFKNYEAFLETIQKKGLGIAEMLAMDMKRDGLYVSRMLSFSDAQFYNLDCSLTDEQKHMYNMAAHIWNEVRKALMVASRRCCCKSKLQVFWSHHQRFFQQMCISMKVDMVVAEAKQAIDEGKCVVIGLQNTGEASLDGKLARDGQVNTFISSCREILLSLLHHHFPVIREIQTAAPLQTTIPYDDWSLRARNMLIEYAKQLVLPDCALDSLIDKLGGPSHVAEMTGRKGRIIRKHASSKPEYELRHSGCLSDQSLNVSERDKFMSGKKLVAIISDAASTGISLHADKNCSNHRQRVHITLQLPWSADKAVQQLGRSHRSNQVSGPIYKLITTELGGERRFAASVAKRLQSLGALTKGDRRAATGADLSHFNYDTMYGRAALRLTYQAICKGQLPSTISAEQLTFGFFTKEVFISHMRSCLVTMGLLTENEALQGIMVADSDSRDVGRFLNRILGLQVTFQNLIFNFFVHHVDMVVTSAKKEGKFNEGFVDLSGNTVSMHGQPKEVFASLCNGCRQVGLMVDRGMSWADAMKRYEALKGGDKVSGFYKSRNAMHNNYFYLLITPHVFPYYKITRPNTGINAQELDREEINHKYEKISLDKAEAEWNRMYERSVTRCNHGSSCNNPKYCTVGLRNYRVNLISGSLMTLLPLLELTIFKYGLKLGLSKHDMVVKVIRVCLDNQERLIGFQFPEILMSMAEKEAKSMALERKTTLFSYYCNTVEPVAPVVAKLVKRASIPPPTIKTYFTTIKKCAASPAANPSLPDIVEVNMKEGEEKKSYFSAKNGKVSAASSDQETDDDIICVLDTTPKQKRKPLLKRGLPSLKKLKK